MTDDPRIEAVASVLLGSVNAPEQEIYRAATAALRAADAAAWRGIASAPKDGHILLCGEVDGRSYCVSGCWDPEFRAVGFDEGTYKTVYEGAWTDYSVADWEMGQYVELHPTHWQPLPSHPTTQEPS